MMRSEDLAPLLAAQPAAPVGFRQGVVIDWDPLTAENTIEVGGAVLTNLPTIASNAEVLLMQPGDVVGIQVVGNGATSTMYIIGRITHPGTAQAASIMQMFGLQAAKVATLDTTASTTYTNLNSTFGPQLTAQIGPTGRCLVILTADINVTNGLATSGTAEGYMSFDTSNPSPFFPFASDDWSLSTRVVWLTGGATVQIVEETQKSRVVLVTGLSAGPHTFTAKYRAAFGTVDFSRRELVVLPF